MVQAQPTYAGLAEEDPAVQLGRRHVVDEEMVGDGAERLVSQPMSAAHAPRV